MNISVSGISRMHKYEAYRIKTDDNSKISSIAVKPENIIQKGNDTFVLTDEAKKQMEKDKKYFYLKDEAETAFENSKKEADAKENSLKNELAMMKIFRRIAKGDVVPPKDEEALMKYNNGLYMAAKNLAMMVKNRHRKKHKSVIDELEKEAKEKAEKEQTQSGDTEEVNFDEAAQNLIESIGEIDGSSDISCEETGTSIDLSI